MGQQQLLLILVGLIIIGLSIVIVVKLFDVNSLEANGDAVYIDTVDIATAAQHYYQLPRMLSGGGGSFEGFVLPNSYENSDNGTFSISNVTQNSITISGVGKEQDPEGRAYHITMVVTPTNIQSSSSVLR